ncbi:hypothetical protein [Arenivirga flava]|uniref:Uncharacterized protein n=1 Tax=Arenivirga flava TaxID=1930060 RepID=A0AA37XA66_9MICO|nr:hypothetical protein [Arenivirga flava]GMA29474.1 hypothetical protein GCM10025874_27270 [Arenivirga flava]
MESESARARETLAALGEDRRRIGERMTAETWWAAPAQGFGSALLVAAPVAGLQWAWVPFIAGAVVFTAVEALFRRRSGVAIGRPAGPLGVLLLVAIGLLHVAAVGGTVVLSVLELHGWAVALAALTGVVMALGVVGYDRVFAQEVRRAR